MRAAAFVDVDDTLITVKSLFRFIAFDMHRRGLGERDYERAMGRLHAMRAAGWPREEVNRAYFELWAGRDERSVAVAGEAWFAAELNTGRLFHRPVLAAVRRHAAAGEAVVLVSGSFPACLDPIARYVGADVLLCARPVVDGGRLTGEVRPMIGAAKAVAVQAEAARLGIDLKASTAYGDHASDLPVLRLVGNPVVVGADAVLNDCARRLGWPVLPAAEVESVR